MPSGASFNVHVAGGLPHRASPANSRGHYTLLEKGEIESGPGAVVITTHNSAPGDISNNHHFGVWYDGDRWAIFNQDLASIASDSFPAGTLFNVRAWAAPGIYADGPPSFAGRSMYGDERLRQMSGDHG
jgi:hypothetical protein